MIARTAAFSLHASVNGVEHTAPARSAFLRSFEDKVDPDRQLPPEERNRRAIAARKAHFTAMALKSSRVRAARKASR